MKSEFQTIEHTINVPLDHLEKSSQKIELFAREIFLPKNKNAEIFVYLQGGPGFSSPRNIDNSKSLKYLVELGYRVVLLDQRGTGRSSKIDPEIATRMSQKELANYFSFFRAREIVYDLEHLREKVFKVNKWFLLGQSYGGFVAFSYLSYFPNSVKGAILCGGVPPIFANDVNTIYHEIQKAIKARNDDYYKQFPEDKKVIKRIMNILHNKPYQLPDGGIVSPQRFLDIGAKLGQTNGPKLMHDFLENPFLNSNHKELSFEFITSVVRQTSFETNPIYAVLHEACYCNDMVSNWAADQMIKTHPTFQNSQQFCFYGETIRRDMFDEYKMLRPYKKAAQILAEKQWEPLYDINQLENNIVPVEAMVYETDYYVNYKLTMNSVERISAIKTWVHPEWQHDGLRLHGKEIIKKLLARLIKRLK